MIEEFRVSVKSTLQELSKDSWYTLRHHHPDNSNHKKRKFLRQKLRAKLNRNT